MGFFLLALLIVETFLGVVVLRIDDPSIRMTSIYLGAAMFGLVTIIVFIITLIDPRRLTHSGSEHLESERMAYEAKEPAETQQGSDQQAQQTVQQGPVRLLERAAGSAELPDSPTPTILLNPENIPQNLPPAC